MSDLNPTPEPDTGGDGPPTTKKPKDEEDVRVSTLVPYKKTWDKWHLPSQFWALCRQTFILLTIVTTQVIFWYICSYDHRISEETIGLLVIFYICDLIYLVDTTLRVIKVCKETQLKRHLTWIGRIKNYFPFVADVVSLLPFEILVFTVHNYEPAVNRSQETTYEIFDDGSVGEALLDSTFIRLQNFQLTVAILRLNRIIRLYRLPAFYQGETKNDNRVNVFAVQTIKLGICVASFLILLCHAIACIWFTMNCSGVLYTGNPPVCTGFGEGFQGIYKYSALNQTDPFVWYLGGLHWSVMSLRNTGDPVLVARNINQMLFSVITQLIGFYMTLFIMLMSFHVATIFDLKRSKYFHEANGAKRFANHMRLDTDPVLEDYIDRSFNYMWKKGRGFTDSAMVHLLPNRLRLDIAMEIFSAMIEKSEILRSCFDFEELELLANCVQIKHYFGDSFLLWPKSLGACMFYVIRGTVDVMDENSDDPTILFTLGPGSLIGETDAFFPRYRHSGVKTRYECDVLKLTNASVIKVVGEDSETMEKVLEIMKVEKETLLKYLLNCNNVKSRIRFGFGANADAEAEVRSRGSSSSAASAQFAVVVEEDYVEKPSPIAHITPFSWLGFFKRTSHNLALASSKVTEAKETFEEFEENEEATTKYGFVQVAPWPEHRWEYGVVSKISTFADLWNFTVFLVALMYSYGLPVCVMLNNERRTWWVEVFVDVVNMADLVLRLVVFYKPSEMHHTIPHRWAHVKREFKNPDILLSLIPALPFHHIWRFAGTSYRSYLYVRLHLYVVRLITVHLYFRKWEHDVRTSVIFVRMLKHTVYISIYVIFFSCIFCSFGCVAYPNCAQTEGETWVGQYINLTTAGMPQDFQEFYYAFLLSLYWCLSSMFGIGYTTDYLQLVQKKESTLFTVNLVLSFFVLTYFFADIGCAIAASIDNTMPVRYAHVSILRYLEEESIDYKILDQVTTFLHLQRRRRLQGVDPNQPGFLQVSNVMLRELFVSAVAETLHSAYFFQLMNPHVLKACCGLCKLNVLPPNVCLMLEGEMVEGLYVIRRGYAEVYKGGTDILVDILSVGQSFGDMELIYGQPSRVTVRSVTHVELLCVSKQDFKQILATSEFHSQEVQDIKSHPEANEWYQEQFLVTESEWRKNQYVSPPPQPQLVRWYAFNGLPGVDRSQDPYLALFTGPVLRAARFFLLPCGIIPTGPLALFWHKFRAIVALLLLVFVPMVQANPYMRNDRMGFLYFLDILCVLDMLVRVHMGYFDSKTKGLVTHPLLTAKRYFLGPFLIDLYSSFLIYELIDWFLTATAFEGATHGNRLSAYFLRLNRLVGTYRCWPFVKESFQNLTAKGNWKIAMLLSVTLMFLTHFIACVTIVLACPITIKEYEEQDGVCYPNTWIREGTHTRRLVASNLTVRGSHIYLFAFYYTATTAVGCGFGDFQPVGQFEQALTSVQLFIYIIIFVSIIAKVVSSRSLFDYKLLKYQYSMKVLVGWLSRENVSMVLVRLLRHFDYYWMRTEGVRTQELWPYLYPTLKKDAMYDIYEDVFRLVPEFHHVPLVFMREILACIELRYYLNHEVIVRIGEPCDFIYVIGSGNMVVKLGTLVEETDDDMIQLSEGGILGSMDPTVCQAFHDCTAICWTNVDMYVIPREDFIRVVRKYPDVATGFIVPAHYASRTARLSQVAKTKLIDVVTKEFDDQQLNLSKSSTLRATLRRELNAAIAADNLDLGEHRIAQGTTHILSEDLAEVMAVYDVAKKKQEKERYTTSQLLDTCLLPVSKNFLILDSIFFWAAAVSSGLTAFQFAFQRYDWTFWILGMVTDAIFILKMILRFFITYYDEMGDLISNVLEIEQGYLSSYDGFIMDLFTSLPFELFTLIYTAVAPASEDKTQIAFLFWASLRLNRLLRLQFVMKHVSQMLRKGGLNINLVYLKIKRLIITTLILLHWLVIIFYMATVSMKAVSVIGNSCPPNRTRVVTANFSGFIPRSWTETKRETWHYLCYPYTMTLYFLVNTFTTTGYGDIYPITSFEILFISLLALASKVYVGMALMDVLSGIQYYVDKSFQISADATLQRYHAYGLPSNLVHQVKSYFHYAWQQNSGVILPDLLIQAPEVHLSDICYNVYGHVFENSVLFHTLPLQFYKYICTKFHSAWVLEGDCVANQGDLDDRLYFVHRGVVESRRDTYDPVTDDWIVSTVEYSMGTSFGAINGFYGIANYQRTITAKTDVDLVYLTSTELKAIFDKFPAEKAEILGRLLVAWDQFDEDKSLVEESDSSSSTNSEDDEENN